MRSASSSVTRGSISSRWTWPLMLSVTGTAPGPSALTLWALTAGALVEHARRDAARADGFQETSPAEARLVFSSRHEEPLSYADIISSRLCAARARPRAAASADWLRHWSTERPPGRSSIRQSRAPSRTSVYSMPWPRPGPRPVQEKTVRVVHFPDGDCHVDRQGERDPAGQPAQNQQDAADQTRQWRATTASG